MSEEKESYLDNLKIFSDVTKTFFVISFFVLFGLGIIFWNFYDKNPTTAIFWAMACLASGGIIGFLFGIPRVLQDNPSVANKDADKPADIDNKNATDNSAVKDAKHADIDNKNLTDNTANNQNNKANIGSPTAYRIMVNTNLEQISDWLTKIIVGLGLIELRNVAGYLNNLSGYFAIGLGGKGEIQPLASAIIVYFVVIGFLGVYLMTRIYLAQVFSKADRETQETEKLERARITLEEATQQLSKEWKEIKNLGVEKH